ncbi:hypothetical protein [Spirosoma pollinicola]|uniref:Uncharacterized protein n=1 Tax=Spirosoma pollinicola TaxID=2057025 RepID=A0A2K8ZAT8_9BACT|nr:hypothetical protein [Spirosoma pollinicola]AUD06996.1 hypothetical protein CWM47_37365 [Spirosoma pollinicola]
MAQSIESQPELKPITGLKFGLHLGSNYGRSTASLVIEALQSHRETMSDLMFEQIREGEYQNAYSYHESLSEINDLLDGLLFEAVRVADHNDTAFDYKGNPAAHRKELDRVKEDKADRYNRFLKKILSSYSDELKEEAE